MSDVIGAVGIRVVDVSCGDDDNNDDDDDDDEADGDPPRRLFLLSSARRECEGGGGTYDGHDGGEMSLGRTGFDTAVS